MAQTSGELVLIRHAPVAEPGRLWGRGDVAARIDPSEIARVSETVGHANRFVTSPALRCRQTADVLWPGRDIAEDPRLWEQDFGAHDGLAYADLPDLGVLSGAELAAYRPPDGECFTDLCQRVAPALKEYAAPDSVNALVVHAGVIRAALAQVLGAPGAGLAFEIDTLSITRLRSGPKGILSIIEVNRTCASTQSR